MFASTHCRISICLLLGLLAAIGCGSSNGGGAAAGTTSSTGVCVGRGWRDTCLWTMTCSKGRYELLCEDPNDPQLEQALTDANITLDGSNCACVVDQTQAKEVPFDDAFCSNKFDSMDSDREDKARVIVNGICGWTTP